MRRAVVVLALSVAVACQREKPVVSRRPAVSRQPSAVSRPTPHEPARPSKSTPSRCAGDGSYGAAVECIRIAAALKFKSSDGDGEMTRPTSGAERLVVHAKDGEWIAESKRSGIVWTHDGRPANEVPQKLAKLWERLTIFPDPQKKEGAPKLSMEGEVRRYDFTDANTGDRYSVWVSPADGHITKLQVNAWTIEFA
jgi:hypothetical protein